MIVRLKEILHKLPLQVYSPAVLKTKSQLPLHLLPLLGVLVLLVMPAAFSAFGTTGQLYLSFAIKEVLLALLFFLIPVVAFYRNIKAYLYCLLPLVILSPLFIYSITLFRIRPRFELMALIMQTNYAEMLEVISGYIGSFLPVTLLYLLLYLYFTKNTHITRIPFKVALCISLVAAVLSFGRVIYEQGLYAKPLENISRHNPFLVKYYPVSLLGGALTAYYTLAEGQMKVPDDFSFQAFPKDSRPERKIHVLIIGESSRYDRWQLNGYEKPTSPRLLKQENLISYSNVVAGSNQTCMSVPQMITRATPDSIFLQYQEKSILSAFREAGFKTAWLSNQTDQEIFWSGSINWHAKTADLSLFSPSISPNFEFDAYHDERLLPILDSLLHSDEKNVYVVLHTIGNHWNYAKRYPASFDFFKPSGTTIDICRPKAQKRIAVSNSYDNSILYADYIIDSVINMVKRMNAISSVTFLSDHGEDLFDAHPAIIDFHLTESPTTLHVPLFIWTSDLFREVYPEKQQALLANKNRKVGAENTFYTLLDLANLSISKEDPTKSLASPNFIDSQQKYLSKEIKKGKVFSNLLKELN